MKKEEKSESSKKASEGVTEKFVFFLLLAFFSLLEIYGVCWFPDKFPYWINLIYNLLIPILFLVVCFTFFVGVFIVNYINSLEEENSVEEDIETTFSKEGIR